MMLAKNKNYTVLLSNIVIVYTVQPGGTAISTRYTVLLSGTAISTGYTVLPCGTTISRKYTVLTDGTAIIPSLQYYLMKQQLFQDIQYA